MTQAIVKQDDITNGNWTMAQVELIKSMCADKATPDEFKVFLHMSQKYGLDPLAKQIWLQKFWDSKKNQYSPATIFVGYHGMLEIANRNNMLDGLHAECVYNDRGELIGARSTLYKKGSNHPFIAEVDLDEYDNQNNPLWRSKKKTLLKKVANVQNLRQAFSLGQLYIEEEFNEQSQPTNRQEGYTAQQLPAKQEVVDHSTGEIVEAKPVEDKPKRVKKLSDEEMQDRRVKAKLIEELTSGLRTFSFGFGAVQDFIPITMEEFNFTVTAITGTDSPAEALKKYGKDGTLNERLKEKYKGEGLNTGQMLSAALHILYELESIYQQKQQGINNKVDNQELVGATLDEVNDEHPFGF